MRQRSRASSKTAKARRRKTAALIGRNAAKSVDRPPSGAGKETDVTRLTRELDDALERERATGEVLSVISGQPGELSPVFDMILDNALRLCEANVGDIFRIEDGLARVL